MMNDYTQNTGQPQSNGLAIAALITGIIGMILALIPVIGFLSWILSPLATILGFIALRNPVSKGASIGGIVTGIIGILICIAWALLFGAAVAAGAESAGGLEEFGQELEKAAAEAERASEAANQAAGAAGEATGGEATGGGK
jgi:hypothetical protein